MSPEVIAGLDEGTYHADLTTLSASGAKVLLGKRPPSPESEALRFGTLVHVAVLEPDRLSEYRCLDAEKIGVKFDGTPAQNPTMTAAWKKAVAEAEADGVQVVSVDDMTRAVAMREAVMAHPTASRIVEQATDRELSAYADHPTGARVRARFDLAGPIVGDIKTCEDADPAKFRYQARDLFYDLQAAHYFDMAEACGMEPQAFGFVCVEKKPTLSGEHRVSVIELTPDDMAEGRRLMHEACLRWLGNGKRVEFPDYGDGVHTVSLPPRSYIPTTAEEAVA